MIKDGVQAIGSDFLVWYKRNPNRHLIKFKKLYGFADEYLLIVPEEEIGITITDVDQYEHQVMDKYSYMFKDDLCYSIDDIFKLTLEALDLGMRIRQDQLNGISDKSGKELHKEWFENVKKR